MDAVFTAPLKRAEPSAKRIELAKWLSIKRLSIKTPQARRARSFSVASEPTPVCFDGSIAAFFSAAKARQVVF